MNASRIHSRALAARTLPALTLAALATVAGCKGTTDPVPGRGDHILADNYPRIETSPRLGQFLRFDRPITESAPGEPLRITVPVRAATEGYDLPVQYRFTFLDEAGRPVEEQGWRYIMLPARTQQFLDANAVDTGAVDWRLVLRPAR